MFHPLDTVRVEKVSLYREGWSDDLKVNIIGAMEEVTIYQDIHSGTMKAVMTLLDPANIYDTFPLLGGEIIDLFFKDSNSRNPPPSMTFIVDSVGERARDGQQRAMVYQLNLCTYDRYKDLRKEFSSSLKGLYSDIVKTILAEKLGSAKALDIDPTQYNQIFISPYFTPIQACEQIAKRSVGSSLEPFFFFESTTGYKFKSIETLFAKPAYCTLYIQPTRQGVDEKSQRVPYKVEYCGSLNRLREQSEFAYGSDAVFFDTVSRMTEFQQYRYSEVASSESYKKINPYQLIPEADLQVPRRLIFKRDDKSHEGVLYRSMVMGLIDHYRTKFAVPGDINYEPGMIVNLDIPDNSTNRTVFEETTSGRWMIASVAHTIKKETFFSTLELWKESYRKNLLSEFGGLAGASECVGSSVDYTRLQQEVEEAGGIDL